MRDFLVPQTSTNRNYQEPTSTDVYLQEIYLVRTILFLARLVNFIVSVQSIQNV